MAIKFGSHTATQTQPCNGGVQHKFKFDNGFGASVVRHSFSYGNESGLWELAVLGVDGHLTYDTPVTSDVLGHLDDGDVAQALDQIAALTPEVIAAAATERADEARNQRIADLRDELARLEAEAIR